MADTYALLIDQGVKQGFLSMISVTIWPYTVGPFELE